MKYIQCVQNENENVNPIETIKAIKNAGFDGVFVQWYDKDWEVSQEEQLKLCRDLNLDVIFAHLGYDGINNIWLEGDVGDNLVDKYIKNLNEMKENGIDLVVMHLCSKSAAPNPNRIGLNRWQKIIDYAEKLDIKIAFENTKIVGYLEYFFENIKNKNIGICYDSGHDHCHFKDKFDWEYFKNKILVLHLHDNDGNKDLHLLPFDGTINWGNVVNNLKNANYNGVVSLESCYRYEYLNMPLEDFYKLSFEKAKQLNF